MTKALRRTLPSILGFVFFGLALEVLRRELRAAEWHELTSAALAIPPGRLALALAFTVLSYAALSGYDLLAFACLARPISRARVVLTSFLAYAISHNVGGMVSGASVRYRFYTRWGVSAEELPRIVVSYSVTFWLGLLALGGLSLAASPWPGAAELPARGMLRTLGWALMLAAFAYLLLLTLKRTPLRIGRFRWPLPSPGMGLAQLAVSTADWALAAAVVYVLLPSSSLSFLGLVGAFLAAQLLGLASHVPGGLGVFEGLLVVLLRPYLPASQLLPPLVVYRAIYYLLPLCVALLLLVADAYGQRRRDAARLGAALGRLTEQLTPRVLAWFVFLGGVVLLFSGATPAAEGRLQALNRLLPLGVIETSHFVGSIVGAGLLLVSQGLSRRLNAAYYVAVAGVGVGIAASLLKGGDYEEALLLSALLLVLRRARPAFHREAAFFETRFSAGWVCAVLATVAASIWLGFFAFKHVEYSHELWWTFELDSQASRFLRASVAAAVGVLLFGMARLLRSAPPASSPATDADLDAAAGCIALQFSTVAFLVYLRDKSLMFDPERRGFVMYGVQGRTWVAMGDPVGPPSSVAPLVQRFLERCDDFGGVPVFYQTAKEGLHHYADFGLSLVKMGEEARVDLRSFTLDGARAGKLRQALHRLEKDGGSFRVIAAADVPPMLAELREVSDDWLGQKGGGEKGFSLGFFKDDYVARFPVAIVERKGRVEGFANLWPGPGKVDLSIDLMRYRNDAPKGVMEAIFVHLMLWGQREGYDWFALGMAPLSGFEVSPVAPLWARLGSFVYRHGQPFYNFQGLRAYKEKFNPVWEPRYLAYPGGLALPRILADVAALVAGGYRRIFA
jgi:phosphatidylglycerol lysyltransferase